MKYCPNCKYAYEDDVDVCPDCSEELLTGDPAAVPEAFRKSEGVELYTFPGQLYAQMAMELLDREDIPAYQKSAFAGGLAYGPAGGGDFVGAEVTIYVLDDDYDRALAAIEPMIDELSTEDDDEQEI